MNTRILKAEFEFVVPNTLQEALRKIDQHGPEAKVIAGGTDLLVQMKLDTVSPHFLIHIMKLSEMNFIKKEKEWLRIGAATTWRDWLVFCARERQYTALYEAACSLGKVQVRNMGTVGGNLCTASPAADSAPPLLVFQSRVKLASVEGERILPLEDFFKGVNETAMAANELMTEIQIPAMQEGEGSAFKKTTRVSADISKVSCAVAVKRKGDFCTSCRIAMGAVASVPMRIKRIEDIIKRKKVDPSLVERWGRKVAEEIKPITDIRSTSDYRKQVAAVLFKDVFLEAWQRAGGDR